MQFPFFLLFFLFSQTRKKLLYRCSFQFCICLISQYNANKAVHGNSLQNITAHKISEFSALWQNGPTGKTRWAVLVLFHLHLKSISDALHNVVPRQEVSVLVFPESELPRSTMTAFFQIPFRRRTYPLFETVVISAFLADPFSLTKK